MYVCLCICVFVYVCLCVCVSVCLCVCVYVWICVCAHVCLYVCVVVCLYGFVVVWLCGCVVVWLCGCVVVGLCLCSCEALWLCDCVAVWKCGCVPMCRVYVCRGTGVACVRTAGCRGAGGNTICWAIIEESVAAALSANKRKREVGDVVVAGDRVDWDVVRVMGVTGCGIGRCSSEAFGVVLGLGYEGILHPPNSKWVGGAYGRCEFEVCMYLGKKCNVL